MSQGHQRKRQPRFSAAITTTILAGCGMLGGAEPEALAASQLFSEQNCPIQLEGPYPATAIYAAVQDLGVKRWISALTNTDADDPGKMLVLIHAGNKPNPGHGIALQSAAAQGDTLLLNVTALKPEPDRMYAQVIVRPCVLVKVPSAGYQDIEVLEVAPPGG